MATAAAAAEEEEEKGWKEALRKMLPPGAPVPDQDHLDYSIALEYDGPPISFQLPRIQPLDPQSLSRKPPRSNRTKPSTSAVEDEKPKEEEEEEEEEEEGDSELLPKRPPRFNRPHSARPSTVVPHASAAEAEEEKDEEEEDDVSPSASSASRKRSSSPRRRAPVVTFNTREEGDEEDEGSHVDDGEVTPSTPSPVAVVTLQRRRDGKKGLCSRCKKVNFLGEREACLVCDARYCTSCLLKAMGSMPEGRKCVSCIGKSIEESKRSSLGKASRMLRRVCSPLEVKQIMRSEKDCSANQLRPEQLIVNGRKLSRKELDDLFGCANPPQKLKPGRYWYDKDSGQWGKEGEKPDRFITSKLEVGGGLMPNASNGRTGVYFNGREITKSELRLLKLAKVQCPRNTAFWLYDNGSYEEEGQNNIKGNLWGKASTRLICTVLSLPKPPIVHNGRNSNSTNYSNRSVPEYLEQKRVQKLLLFGLEGSGTSTIFKQARFLYGSRYSAEELQNIKLLIQSNMYKYLGKLLEARERFEEEMLEEMKNQFHERETSDEGENGENTTAQCIYSIKQRLKQFSDWFLQIIATGDLETFFPAATREHAPIVEEVWKDPAIQETYKRINVSNIHDVAKYFLDRAIDISSNEYEPSERDILYAEGIDQYNGLAFLEFSLDDRSPMCERYTEHFDGQPPLTRYQLIRVNSKGLSEGCKWLEMFEDVRAVIFCVALSDYDQVWSQGSGPIQNKMMASKELFESLVGHPSFRNTPFILLFNKYDAFEEKIDKTPLTVCEWFRDFSPVSNHSLACHAYYYIAVKFKDLYFSITEEKLFVCQTRSRERVTVNEAFKNIREVLKWDEMKHDYIYAADESIYSTDISTSPYIRAE